MSERKVLNKYYPPDFDPSKIPKLKQARSSTFNIRIMAPFNMRCNTCREYIYKGKKFNSRKETVEDENYLGLYIFRFYIKCPRCVSEIAFKTDPQNTDYTLEAGATRNFEPIRTAEKLAKEEMAAKEQEEIMNPMMVLENRTKASRNEMEMIETLEELRELNARHAKVDHEYMINLNKAYEEQLSQLQDEEDEKLIKSAFGEGGRMKRLADSDSDEEESPKKKIAVEKPSDVLLSTSSDSKSSKPKPQPYEQKSFSSFSSKSSLKGLVKRKQPAATDSKKLIEELPSTSAVKETDDGQSKMTSDKKEQNTSVKVSDSKDAKKSSSSDLLNIESSSSPFLLKDKSSDNLANRKTFKIPESSVLSKVKSFFPMIQEANDKLQADQITDYNIENVPEDEPYIQMDLALVEQDTSSDSDSDSCDENINIGEVDEENFRISKERKTVVIEELKKGDENKDT